ncbi:MAG: hypothetical protein ABIJ04_01330 [Bacteroidota bacterium]
MKTTTLLVMMTLMTALASAQPDTITISQKKSRNVTFEIHAGYSMAFGKYIMTDKDNKLSGYASNGFFVQLSGNWLGKRGLGLAVSYCYQNNAIQADFADDTLVDMSGPLGKKPWNNHYLLAGPAFIKSFGQWLLTVKVQAGGVLAFSPIFRIPMPSTDSLNPLAFTISDGPGFGVAMQALAGIGYRVTDNLTINLAFSFLGGNPNRSKSSSQYIYEEDPETGFINPVYIHIEKERKKKISTFNIGLGISFKL